MFTGIITDIGTLEQIDHAGDVTLTIRCGYELAEVAIGASIACAGVCLTVTSKDLERGCFTVDASAETLSKTNLGEWEPGRRINLERALRVGDELGGHIVSGHADGVVTVVSTAREGDSLRVVLDAPEALARFIAPKGSVTLDGCSLTVNAVDGARFDINLIPHTQGETTLGALEPGMRLNLEIDVLARYVARLAQSAA
ncbi:MAG: riboflavin synthase [Neomegalonema sp.]|nr:riboflavin synthase [Neomegalonema sp.]